MIDHKFKDNNRGMYTTTIDKSSINGIIEQSRNIATVRIKDTVREYKVTQSVARKRSIKAITLRKI